VRRRIAVMTDVTKVRWTFAASAFLLFQPNR
jgi:hypothetical protein